MSFFSRFWPFRKKGPLIAPISPWLEKYFANTNIFKKYNTSRLNHLLSQLKGKKRDIFELIPFLLHQTTTPLPGTSLTDTTLGGIAGYTPTRSQRELARKYFPGYDIQSGTPPSLPIYFMAIMGSAGTIAFTGESDIDVWIGLETNQHNKADLDRFKAKLTAIEKWGMTEARLEIHFFISDLTSLRQEDYGGVEGESCGSALGKLLKDEFYRTAIFTAGKTPFYWIIPSGADDITYHEIIDGLKSDTRFPVTDFVDLGPVSAIHPEEYNGAALWQIMKGLYSPFKSLIKIALLEKYAVEKKTQPPLCELFKQRVFVSQGPDFPDPYLFMIEAVREYYSKQGLVDLRQLMEKCFLIRSTLYGENENTSRFSELAKRWEYSSSEFEDLLNFRFWDFSNNDIIRRRITTFFLDTYQLIRSRTQDTANRISQRDFSIIGKKLQIFFGQKPVKIPFQFSLLLPRSISGIIVEETSNDPKSLRYEIKIAIKSPKRDTLQTIRTLDHPIAALAFCCVNRLFEPGQGFAFKTNLKIAKSDVLHFIDSFRLVFPAMELDSLPGQTVLSEPRLLRFFFWPNWNRPDWNYGIASILLFAQNSHGEILYYGFQGESWQNWLKKFFTDNLSQADLSMVQTMVFKPKEKLIARLKISESLEKTVNSMLRK